MVSTDGNQGDGLHRFKVLFIGKNTRNPVYLMHELCVLAPCYVLMDGKIVE